MTGLTLPEWGQVFVPDLSLAESFVRGTAVYFGILVLFRVVLKRQTGGVGLPDVMLVVLVSECVSAAINGESKSVPNGLVAVAALLFWSYLIDWASHRWGWLRRRLEPRPVELVRDGRVIAEHMKAEQVTDDELAEQLRLNGLDSAAAARRVTLESGGGVSVIPFDSGRAGGVSPLVLDRQQQGADAPRSPEWDDFDAALERFLAAARELRAAAVGRHAGRHEVRV